MDWTFIYLMFVLKIPIAALFWIVWWAVHAEPTPAGERGVGDDGGTHTDRVHPHRPFPRHPRRGPHGDSPAPAPKRVRRVVARARRSDRA